MIASQAGKLISKFIDKSWPNDEEEVYEILKLAVNKAWQEGKWYGMTAEFTVPVECDNSGGKFVISPKEYPTLLAIAIDGKTQAIRDNYFNFHRNGNGIIPSDSCTWQQNVIDIGRIPIINKHNINFECGILVGVRPLGPVGEGEKVWVGGTSEEGKYIISFKNKSVVSSSCSTSCSSDSSTTTTTESVKGSEIKVIDGFHYINNIKFFDIASIHKTKTLSPIEVIAIDHNNNAKVIAVLEPGETESKYRKYAVPSECSTHVRGLFKIRQQENITSGSDVLIIDNEEAIISLAKGIHMMYYKENMEGGAMHVINGISILEKVRREEESPTIFPLQVDPINYMDLPEQLRR
jgi:hypothetical protein